MAVNTYTIKNARLLFRNFAGEKDRFGNTARTFCVILPDDAVDDFRTEGFNIKTLKPRDDTEEPLPYIKVKSTSEVVRPRSSRSSDVLVRS